MLSRNEPTLTHQVGPFTVANGTDELTLRMENRGELSFRGCLLLVGVTVSILVMGLLSILTNAQTMDKPEDPVRFFAPSRNHFGFLWLFGVLGMLVLVPFYVAKAYKAALVFSFCRSADMFCRDGRLVARLSRIEYFAITETKDPDGRYLYLLHVLYNDGDTMLLFNGYDERETMNLANELGSFVGCQTKWST
jgi:hypothetical protein